MTTPHNGGQAFPIADPFSVKSPGTESEALRLRNGMTLRDYFAAKAVQGLLASEVSGPVHEFAAKAYEVADAMLKAREST